MNYVNSFTAMQVTTSPLAFKPIEKDLPDYNFLFAVEREDTEDVLSMYLNLFKGCHLTSSGEHDATSAVELVKVYREDGTYESEPEDGKFLFGVYVRKNLPTWITKILIEAEDIFSYINKESSSVLPLTIDNEEHFAAWLGDDPVPLAFENDVIFAAIDKEVLYPNLKMISGTWELPDNVLLMYHIAEINKESMTVEPRVSLMQLLPYRYRITMDNFKKEVLEGNINLIALVCQK